jgi:hypothetical protein
MHHRTALANPRLIYAAGSRGTDPYEGMMSDFFWGVDWFAAPKGISSSQQSVTAFYCVLIILLDKK